YTSIQFWRLLGDVEHFPTVDLSSITVFRKERTTS
ncbi:unnamed protein product, partial [Allacma fusca]